MIKKIGTFALLILSLSALAQQTEPTQPAATQPAATQPTKRYARPDIPGTFVVEIGVNTALNKPTDFDLGFWGSRTVNLYYQYEFQILKSRWSFVPGVGLSLERFKFKNDYTLGVQQDGTPEMISPTDYDKDIRKSSLVTNYIELPLELRYSTRPNDPSRSFKAAVGFRIGYLYDAFTKVKYREDDVTKKIKDNQNYNLTRFRYGVYAKVGAGNLSVFANYNLSPLFESGKGLQDSDSANDLNTMTIGISFSSF